MTNSTKHRINVVLTVRQYKGLKALAEKRGETIATMIRLSVDVVLDYVAQDTTLPKPRSPK